MIKQLYILSMLLFSIVPSMKAQSGVVHTPTTSNLVNSIQTDNLLAKPFLASCYLSDGLYKRPCEIVASLYEECQLETLERTPKPPSKPNEPKNIPPSTTQQVVEQKELTELEQHFAQSQLPWCQYPLLRLRVLEARLVKNLLEAQKNTPQTNETFALEDVWRNTKMSLGIFEKVSQYRMVSCASRNGVNVPKTKSTYMTGAGPVALTPQQQSRQQQFKEPPMCEKMMMLDEMTAQRIERYRYLLHHLDAQSAQWDTRDQRFVLEDELRQLRIQLNADPATGFIVRM